MYLPEAFQKKMKAILGEEYDDFLAGFEKPRHYGLRVEINMCKAMDQLFQKFENQGIEKGKLNTLKEQLKVKLGTLSSPLEKQLTNTSLEKLNVLTLNIFNINSEEDVLKIIH